jgi:hypothetical protein
MQQARKPMLCSEGFRALGYSIFTSALFVFQDHKLQLEEEIKITQGHLRH